MRTLSHRESRMVAVLILVALIAAVYLLIAAPLVGGFTERAEQREQLVARYQANERMIATIPRLRAATERRERDALRFVLAAPDAETGAELLRDRLQNAIGAVGGEFLGSEDVPGDEGRIGARASASLSIAQLELLLSQLQNTPPFLTIDALAVEAGDAVVVGRASTLEVQIDASIPLRLSRS